MNWRLKILKRIWTPGVGLPLDQVKFYRKHLYEGETNVYINKPGQMTKVAAMPIYSRNPSKIFLSGTAEPIAVKLDM